MDDKEFESLGEVHDGLDSRGRVAERQAWRTESGLADTDEEMAAEIAVPYRVNNVGEEPERRELRRAQQHVQESQANAGRALGIFSLAMAIASLFVWPLLLGLTSAALGYVAYRQGARGLGVWSMTIGLLAAAAYLVFIPIYYVLS